MPGKYISSRRPLSAFGFASADAGGSKSQSDSSEDVRRLEMKLAAMRECLDAVMDELNSTKKELQSSREEGQRLREELAAVKGELALRAAAFERSSRDCRTMLESAKIATVFLDHTLRVTNFTTTASEVFHLEDTDVGRPIGDITPRVVYDDMQDDARRVIETLVAVEREVENPQTHARYMVRILPCRRLDGVTSDAIVTFTDITPLTVAQAALQQSEARLRLVTERIPQLVWTAEASGAWTWSGVQWTEHTGQAAQKALDFGWMDMLHPDDVELVRDGWKSAQAFGRLDLEHRLHVKGGSYRWVQTRAVPMDCSDNPNGAEWFGTCTDVHDAHELRDQQSVLVAELQHRTRNLLAFVKALAETTLSGSASLEDFHARFSPRLEALSRVQGQLSRLHDEERVHFDQLLRAELTAHGAGLEPGSAACPKIIFDGPTSVRVRSSSVQILALALHELATNATKYGALSQAHGTLRVTWRLTRLADGEQRLRVVWEETGVTHTPPLDQARRGYGRTLIEQALPYQIRAKTDYELNADGVTCVIDLPVFDDEGAIRG